MLRFDNDKSQKLDEELIAVLSDLVNSQELVKEKVARYNFLIRERQIIYNLLIRVNEERQASSF